MYGMGGMGYGGGYSSYGGYGGSSYGGYGSYGTGYGSGYGSSYGSTGGGLYGNRSGNTAALTTAKAGEKNEEGKPEDPNNPQNAPGQKQRIQQTNHRRMIFEEWFKMMGGLRSILQLGFAAIALANFWSRSAQIFRKFLEFAKQAGKSMGVFIESKIPTKIFTNLSSPEKRGKAIKSIVMTVIRLFAGALLLLGFQLRREIREQGIRREAAMKQELQAMKQQQVELVEEREGDEIGMQRQALQEANL